MTLQSVLTCEWTQRYLTLTTGYRNNYRPHGLETRDWSSMPHDQRLGASMIILSLRSATRLSHLSLERLASDEMMLTIATSATHLSFLNINNSKVTDTGLLTLAGLKNQVCRAKLSRKCKTESGEEDSLGSVRNWTPRWSKDDNLGCDRLEHLEATNLNLNWSVPGASNLGYKDFSSVPMDAGFVGILDSLTQLKVLNSEVGARSVQAWQKWKKKVRQNNKRTLSLQVLTESRPSPALLSCVSVVCPDLTQLRIDWTGFSIGNVPGREDWVPSLPALTNLSTLFTSDIDHKTDHLSSLMPNIGARLTKLHLQEMWSISTSLVRAIKENCVNLTRLVIFMSVKDLLGSMTQIHMDRDAELCCQETLSSAGMKKLTEVHLMGPFKSEFTRYLLDSSPNIETLTLSVDYPDPVRFYFA